MKIVFIGSVKFSAEVLQQLVEMSADVVGVCTKEESVFNADHAPCQLRPAGPTGPGTPCGPIGPCTPGGITAET